MDNKFILEIKPRFRDTDGMGHVNNSVFITYLEVARSDWFLENFSELNIKDFDFIIARVEMDFKAPILLRSLVKIEMIVSRIGNSSWEFEYILSDKNTNEIYALAKTVQVAYDYENKKSKPLTERIIPYLTKMSK